jgi:hypothetical protein
MKPHNIFLAPDGTAKIGDFGLSRILNSDDPMGKTASYTANVGSPAYSKCPLIILVPPVLLKYRRFCLVAHRASGARAAKFRRLEDTL